MSFTRCCGALGLLLLALLGAAEVSAQAPTGPAAAAAAAAAIGVQRDAEHDRIAARRAELERAHGARERACRERFALAACVDEVATQRRRELAALREQELKLDDAQRQQRADARRRAIERRQAGARATPPATTRAPVPVPVPAALAEGEGSAGTSATAPPAVSAPSPSATTPAAAAVATETAMTPDRNPAARAAPTRSRADLPARRGTKEAESSATTGAPAPRTAGTATDLAARATERAAVAARRASEADAHGRRVQRKLEERARSGRAAAPLPAPAASASGG